MYEVIDLDQLPAICYPYKNHGSAEASSNPRGTGFMVAFDEGIFAVTNWQVGCSDGASCIGFSTRDSREGFEYDPSRWQCRPDLCYLAVVWLPAGNNFGMRSVLR